MSASRSAWRCDTSAKSALANELELALDAAGERLVRSRVGGAHACPAVANASRKSPSIALTWSSLAGSRSKRAWRR